MRAPFRESEPGRERLREGSVLHLSLPLEAEQSHFSAETLEVQKWCGHMTPDTALPGSREGDAVTGKESLERQVARADDTGGGGRVGFQNLELACLSPH